jgi:hypothetical protein
MVSSSWRLIAMACRGCISFQPPTKVAKHSSWFSPGASWLKMSIRRVTRVWLAH